MDRPEWTTLKPPISCGRGPACLVPWTHIPCQDLLSGGCTAAGAKHDIPNPKLETRNPRPGTRNPKPETRNPKPKTRNPKSESRNPEQETRTKTLHPVDALHLVRRQIPELGSHILGPETRNPQPETRDSQFETQSFNPSSGVVDWAVHPHGGVRTLHQRSTCITQLT